MIDKASFKLHVVYESLDTLMFVAQIETFLPEFAIQPNIGHKIVVEDSLEFCEPGGPVDATNTQIGGEIVDIIHVPGDKCSVHIDLRAAVSTPGDLIKTYHILKLKGWEIEVHYIDCVEELHGLFDLDEEIPVEDTFFSQMLKMTREDDR